MTVTSAAPKRFRIVFYWDPASARRAARGYLWTTQATYVVAATVIGALCLASFRDASLRPLATFGLGAVGVFAYGWAWALVRAGRGFAAGEVVAVLEDSIFTVGAPWGRAQYPWGAVRELRQSARFVFLVLRTDRPLALPVAALPEEAILYLRDRVVAHRGRLI